MSEPAVIRLSLSEIAHSSCLGARRIIIINLRNVNTKSKIFFFIENNEINFSLSNAFKMNDCFGKK